MFCRGCGCPGHGVDRLLQRVLGEEEDPLLEALDWDAVECYDAIDEQALGCVRALLANGQVSEVGNCVGPSVVTDEKIYEDSKVLCDSCYHLLRSRFKNPETLTAILQLMGADDAQAQIDFGGIEEHWADVFAIFGDCFRFVIHPLRVKLQPEEAMPILTPPREIASASSSSASHSSSPPKSKRSRHCQLSSLEQRPLSRILGFLDHKSLCQVEATCWSMRAAVVNSDAWQSCCEAQSWFELAKCHSDADGRVTILEPHCQLNEDFFVNHTDIHYMVQVRIPTEEQVAKPQSRNGVAIAGASVGQNGDSSPQLNWRQLFRVCYSSLSQRNRRRIEHIHDQFAALVTLRATDGKVGAV